MRSERRRHRSSPGRTTGRGRVERRESDPFGDRTPVGVRLDQHDLGIRCLCDPGDQEPDRSRPHDDRRLTRLQTGPPDVVNRDRCRLDERPLAQRQVLGEWHHQLGRHGPPLLHRTREVDTNDPELLTDVRVAGTARGAFAAPPQRHHGDLLADQVGRHVVPDRRDGAGRLVSEHGGMRDPVVHGAMADVQVGATDPDVRDRDLHLTRTRRHQRAIHDPHHAVPRVHRRSHSVTLLARHLKGRRFTPRLPGLVRRVLSG